MKKIFLCALSNVSSGNCGEDCKFCTQSAKYQTGIQTYKQKDINEVVQEAISAKNSMANGFCLVTSGLRLNKSTKKYIIDLATAIKEKVKIRLIACNGLASLEDLQDLKKAGISAYNHNLETSQSFYKQICTSHPWQDRFDTCVNVTKAGLDLICGGIFGIGESKAQRLELFESIKKLNPRRIPINFYIPNEHLDLPQTLMSKQEALEIIKQARSMFARQIIMVAGGRELVFGDSWLQTLEAGANSIIIGGYLTSSGNEMLQDVQTLQDNGYEISFTN